MGKIVRHIVLVISLCNVFGAAAQTLSLDSCLALARRNNVKIRNAELEIEAAKQVKKQTVTKYFPDIKATATAFHALHPLVEYGIDDVSNAGARDLLYTLYAEYGAALGLDNTLALFKHGVVAGVSALQPVFVGGQIVNGNRLAQLGIEAAELKRDVATDELLLQTEESYWLVVSLYEKRKTIAQAQTLLDTLWRDVTNACDAGLVTKNDLLKVSLKQNELNSNKLQVDNAILLATMALCQTIGVFYSDTLMLADTLITTDAPLALYVDANDAVAQRTESRLLDLNVEAEILQRKMIVGKSLPQIALGATYGYGNLFEKDAFNGMLLVTAQMPLTGWWETGHKLKEQKVRLQIAENNRRDLTEKMQLQTIQAWSNLQQAYSQQTLAAEAVNHSTDNLTIAQHNYAAGLIALSELLEAQTLHQQALDTQCDRRIAYQIALRQYRQLTQPTD